MMDQPCGDPLVLAAAADLQRLPQGVGDHFGVLGGGDSPAEDAAGEHVDDEPDVDEPGQRPHIRRTRPPTAGRSPWAHASHA